MKRRMQWVMVAATAVLLAGAAGRVLGQASAVAPAVPAFDVSAFVAPYVDEQTIAVVHLDVARLDTAALETYVSGMLDDAKFPANAPAREMVGQLRTAADVMLARFKQLGGRHVVLLLSHPDIWPNLEPLAMLLKIEKGGDAKMLKELLISTVGSNRLAPGEQGNTGNMEFPPGTPEVVMLRDDVLFVGQDAALQRLKTLKPVARPELAIPASEVVLEGVAAMTADERRVVREMMPTFPPEIGGGSTEFLTRGRGVGVTLRVKLPPEPSVAISVTEVLTDGARGGGANNERLGQSPELQAFILRLRDLALENADFKAALETPELKPMAADIRAVVQDVLTPKGGALLVLGDKQIRVLARMLMPAVGQAQAQADRVRTMSQMRQVLVACLIYANDNKEILPATLDQLVEGKFLEASLLVNGRDAKHRALVYKRWVPELAKVRNGATTPMVWEEVDDDKEPRCVGFVDGHVEVVRDREALDALLKAAQAAFDPAGRP